MKILFFLSVALLCNRSALAGNTTMAAKAVSGLSDDAVRVIKALEEKAGKSGQVVRKTVSWAGKEKGTTLGFFEPKLVKGVQTAQISKAEIADGQGILVHYNMNPVFNANTSTELHGVEEGFSIAGPSSVVPLKGVTRLKQTTKTPGLGGYTTDATYGATPDGFKAVPFYAATEGGVTTTALISGPRTVRLATLSTPAKPIEFTLPAELKGDALQVEVDSHLTVLEVTTKEGNRGRYMIKSVEPPNFALVGGIVKVPEEGILATVTELPKAIATGTAVKGARRLVPAAGATGAGAAAGSASGAD